MTAIGVLFGGEEALAPAVLNELNELGYRACVAIADTVGAAWALAAASEATTTPWLVLPPGDTAALAALPLSCLRLDAETLGLFAQLGLTRIEELLRLPRASLTSRFGERLLWRLDQLLGAAAETIVPHRPPPAFLVERCSSIRPRVVS